MTGRRQCSVTRCADLDKAGSAQGYSGYLDHVLLGDSELLDLWAEAGGEPWHGGVEALRQVLRMPGE
ncbi:hypothetical protein AB0E78_33930 [Streptomyces sp. NPDC032198]|uniref:hypothetical protein n=1 Tax=Streptomyces sp. NPDC032198 TaxID=3155127 RepID=UPI0033D12435